MKPRAIKCVFIFVLVVFANTTFAQNHTTTIAVIGDFGRAGVHEKAVSDLVHSWKPDAIITTGDNNYEFGQAITIDSNIGQYYSDYIGNYKGIFGKGSVKNKFFPSLGNHDWVAANAQPYLDYFTLPGNERYYDFVKENIHFFAIDSDPHEADGLDEHSIQAQWLKEKLASSKEPWKIVYFHHPPYCSGAEHGSTKTMQWSFRQWGASLVLSGHEHLYERLLVDSMDYIVNGVGGKSLYKIGKPIEGSIVRYNENYGAILITADNKKLKVVFQNIDKQTIDALTLYPR